jgi:selenide, water dikinase
LQPLQSVFNPADYPNLLVGLALPDDAAVYKLDDERALIFTTDFFTPIVDDPVSYGAIAAANALSDVYAMGGTPLLALNIAAFPEDLPIAILSDILRGSAEKVHEAGAVIAGGHTIKDKEPKVGLAVIGMAHPDKLFTKQGAQPGDVLILTKPLGTGTITTAGKNDRVEAAHLEEAIRWMSALNRDASQAALHAGAHAVTDVTGFGLMGHSIEMAEQGNVTFRFRADTVPLMSGVEGYAEQWIFPGGSTDNKRTFESKVHFEDGVIKERQMILFDAQTSGGLLIVLQPDAVTRFADHTSRTNTPWWQIGEVSSPGDKRIEVSR